MSHIKHIIWDWNGTLFNDVDLCRQIINGLLIRRNLKALSLEDYRNIFTFPVQDYYEKAGLDFTRYPFDMLGREWMDEYEERKLECGLHEGAADVLEMISLKGIGQSILSAYSQDTLEGVVKHFGLDKYFANMVGLDHIYATSKIENGRELIKKLGNGNGENLFIGDTVHDYEVAREIGAGCILIAEGHQEKVKLEACGVPVFNNIRSIPFDEIL
jgi:phosphoglycolate phosphatase